MDREAITAANQLRSPLLRLPGEIRNRIYGYAFCGEDNTENALLKTCKQIEHESKPIYYSHLTLSFTHFDDIRHVIARVRPELLAMVKSVRTGAVTAKTMAVSILQDASEDASDKLDWSECVEYVTGLKYWHIDGNLHPDFHNGAVKDIKEYVGRDVEVTFATMEEMRLGPRIRIGAWLTSI